MKYKTAVGPLGLVMILFLAIALIAIGLIFSPVTVRSINSTYDIFLTPPATTTSGLALRAEAWRKYPEYNRGLGLIAVLSFASAVYVGFVMVALKSENDALQSISSGEKEECGG